MDFWIPSVKVPVGYDHHTTLPVWLGVSGYSHFATGLMVPSRKIHDLLAGHLAGSSLWAGFHAPGV